MAKPSTIDQEIIDALKTTISAIAAGTEYYSTLSGKVYDSSAAPITDGVNLSEGDEEISESESSASLHYCRLPVLIDIVELNANAANIRKTKADILKAIRLSNNLGLTNKVYDIKHISTQANVPDQQGNLIAHRRIQIDVYYRKNAFSI
ncbi:MAG: hypothetical protein WC879_03415 [Melioribacteraceae bacterium]